MAPRLLFPILDAATLNENEELHSRWVALLANAAIGDDLAARKQLYIEARLEGKSRRASALTAGYSESMANHPYKIETKDVRDAFAALMREAVPPERIAKTIAEGMGATETKFFSHEGSLDDVADDAR